MKKILIIPAIIFSVASFGQKHFVGLKSGATLTNFISYDWFSNMDNRVGLNGGVTYQYRLGDKFNLGAEMLYFQKGASSLFYRFDNSGNQTNNKFRVEQNYDYLSMPIKGGLILGNRFSGFANLGVVPSFFLKGDFVQPELVIELTPDRKFDFGGLVEVGAFYKLTSLFLISASVEYQQSFLSFVTIGSGSRHHGASLSLGLQYAIGKSN